MGWGLGGPSGGGSRGRGLRWGSCGGVCYRRSTQGNSGWAGEIERPPTRGTWAVRPRRSAPAAAEAGGFGLQPRRRRSGSRAAIGEPLWATDERSGGGPSRATSMLIERERRREVGRTSASLRAELLWAQPVRVARSGAERSVRRSLSDGARESLTSWVQSSRRTNGSNGISSDCYTVAEELRV